MLHVLIRLILTEALGQRLEFDMKYHILNDFRTTTPFKEKSSNHLKDLQKLKFMTNFDVILTSR